MIDINHAKRELKALSGMDSPFGEMCGEVLEYINSLEERIAIMTEGKPDDEECMAEIADHSELKRMKIKNDRLKNELERLRRRYCSLCKRSNYSKEKSVGGYCGVNCRYRKGIYHIL